MSAVNHVVQQHLSVCHAVHMLNMQMPNERAEDCLCSFDPTCPLQLIPAILHVLLHFLPLILSVHCGLVL